MTPESRPQAQPCPELTSMLLRAADNRLDAEERADLDEHLRECRGCREALAGQALARRALQARPAVHASPAFRVRVADAVARERRSVLHLLDYQRWTLRLAPVAAILLTAIALGLPHVNDAANAETAATTAGQAADGSDLDPAVRAELPVSSALYAGDVPASSLESLLLVGDPDRRLGDYAQAQGGGR